MLRVPSNERRLDILEWLRDPATHFPPQPHADPVTDGVCSQSVADKLGVSRPVASAHLELLAGIGLLRATRISSRTFYRRDEERIADVRWLFEKGW
ncbi:helix-turn-helix domain-containing protein [Streptomyces sp. NPDC005485]|uniref:ArsR/SmtB family transcription factor n=1 Tax=Streptomyces sp. NPDC005485 TaxID=3155591 RepID=UPI0033B1B9F1